MEITEINGEVLKKIIKCKEGEFLFATYDATKDPEITSDEIQEVINANVFSYQKKTSKYP